jgi:hypothetical protein
LSKTAVLVTSWPAAFLPLWLIAHEKCSWPPASGWLDLKKHLIKASFRDLLAQDLSPEAFRFVSSFAIHRLVMSEKEALFKYIYRRLDSGGFFLNIDVVLSPTDDLVNTSLRRRHIENGDPAVIGLLRYTSKAKVLSKELR